MKIEDDALPEWLSGSDVPQQIGEIVDYIRQLRSDLSGFYPAHSDKVHIPTARAELGAVVTATENAANQIMDACDALGAELRGGGGLANDKAMAALNSIYEACSFQDLTSQRVVKVQHTLGIIEQKLTDLGSRLGLDMEAIQAAAAGGQIDENDESTLLNGPAMPGAGIDQSDVDSLFG